MLKNLIDTWCKLAPNEVSLRRAQNPKEEQFILQGYLQEVIKRRGWTSSVRVFPDHSTARVWVDDEDETEYNKCHEFSYYALLTAYLKALAAQRSIPMGLAFKWKHYKGGFVYTNGIAGPSLHKQEESIFLGEYLYKNSFKLHLWANKKCLKYTCNETVSLLDRVFYTREEDKDDIAEDLIDFIDLVGLEDPDAQGLLKFEMVGNK